MMNVFKLAGAQTLRLWRAGTIRVLLFALIVATTAMTAVGFFTQRMNDALVQQGGVLLGGDVVISSDHPVPVHFDDHARALQVKVVRTAEFPSMVIVEKNGKNLSQLAEVKAVGQGFPMRGTLTIANKISDVGQEVSMTPKLGEVWIEPRLANLLRAKVGDTLTLGAATFKVGAILLNEPSRGGDMFRFSPRIMLHWADLPKTQLIQFGSRVKYQLILAGEPEKIARYVNQNTPLLVRGEKMQDVQNARPEIKSALDKAQKFLALAAVVTVMLSMVAMVLSSLPYIKHSVETFALMRCFGTSKKMTLQIFTVQTLLIASMGAVLGVLLGFFLQLGLEKSLGQLFVASIPPVRWQPVLVTICVSLVMMAAVVLPHVWQLRQHTTMHILRDQTFMASPLTYRQFLPAVLVMLMAIFWQAQHTQLAIAMCVALLLLGVMIFFTALLVIRFSLYVLSVFPSSMAFNMAQMGLKAVKRRLGLSMIQMYGFSVGLMVLMLLLVLRNDIINTWQASLPANAPNRFLINVQEDQRAAVQDFFEAQKIADAHIFPMIRGRLVLKNGQPIQQENFTDERAKRLIEREFNLSMAAQMQGDNQLVAGRWWQESEQGQPFISLEEGIAKSLNIQLGDQLVFDVAGTKLPLTVLSIRKVDWDTMRANFFAVTPPKVLDAFTATYISSFYLPESDASVLNELVQKMPNLTVIDLAALLKQVRSIMQQMGQAIEWVFLLSLLAGVAVLYATLIATQEERIKEATLFRVFGSAKRGVSIAYLVEFSLIGFVAALVAAVAAQALSYYLSTYVLEIPFNINIVALLLSIGAATLFVPLAAWLAAHKNFNIPPRQLLQSV